MLLELDSHSVSSYFEYEFDLYTVSKLEFLSQTVPNVDIVSHTVPIGAKARLLAGGGPGLPAGNDRLLAVPPFLEPGRADAQRRRHRRHRTRRQHDRGARPEELHRGAELSPEVSETLIVHIERSRVTLQCHRHQLADQGGVADHDQRAHEGGPGRRQGRAARTLRGEPCAEEAEKELRLQVSGFGISYSLHFLCCFECIIVGQYFFIFFIFV